MRTDFDAQWDELAERGVERDEGMAFAASQGHAPPDRSGAGRALGEDAGAHAAGCGVSQCGCRSQSGASHRTARV